MKKKFFAVVAVTLAVAMGATGCSGIADLFKGKDKDVEESAAPAVDAEELIKNMVSMDERRDEILKDIDKLVTLGDYKNIEVTIPATKVTDEQIQEQIDMALAAAGTTEQIKEGTVAEGDSINIDYEGKMDGETFDGGTAQGANLVIGSNSFIDGFEEALIGAAIGSTVEINVTFPDPYKQNPDFSGKPAVFTVTVNYKNGESVPAELSDEFVTTWASQQGLSDITTVEAFRNYIKEQLEAEAESADQSAAYSAIMEKIMSGSQIHGISEDLNKDELIESEINYMKEYAESYSMELSDFLEQYLEQTEEEYREDLSKDIDRYFNNLMLYRAVIYAENLQVDQDEYEQKVLSYSPQYESYDVDSELDFVKEYSGEIYDSMLNQVAEDFILDNAKITKTE